jgi:hypothetical protein
LSCHLFSRADDHVLKLFDTFCTGHPSLLARRHCVVMLRAPC